MDAGSGLARGTGAPQAFLSTFRVRRVQTTQCLIPWWAQKRVWGGETHPTRLWHPAQTSGFGSPEADALMGTGSLPLLKEGPRAAKDPAQPAG